MAINYSYPKDLVIESADLFLGIRASDNRTVNYTAKAVSNYLNTNAEISISSQLSFRFTTISNIAKTISFPGGLGDGTLFSAITELVVSIIDASSSNVTIYLDYLIDSDILLSQQNEPNNFGHYKITGYTQNGITPFYTLALEFIGGNGNIVDDTYYDIAPLNLNQGGGNQTFQQVINTGDTLSDGAGTDMTMAPSGMFFTNTVTPGYTLESFVGFDGYAFINYDDGEGTTITCSNTGFFFGSTSDSTALGFGTLEVQNALYDTYFLPEKIISIDRTTLKSISFLYPTSVVSTNKTVQWRDRGGNPAFTDEIPSLTGYATESWVGSNFYPLATNPAGYLTTAVTSVSASGLITSSGGNTPAISTSMNTGKLVGRSSSGVGAMEEITIGAGLTLAGGTLSADGGSGGIPHGTAAGTDTYTVTISGVTAYTDGDAFLIRFPNGNTTGATLNINGIGAVALYRNNDGPLLGGDILDGGEMICVYNSTTTAFQCIGTSPNSLYAYVKNDDSVTLTKGMPVYAFSGTGDRMTVKRANNTGDATSAQTVGLVMSSSIAAGQKGLIMVQGLLDGLSILPTATWTDGDPVYLGATDGSITNVKPYAPNHLVYLGVVTTASNGSAGRMYVRVQNGYELQELHNVQITSTPTNNDVLTYEASSSLYKMKSLGTILGYTPYKYLATNSTPHIGTLSETVISTATILGGTYNSSDVMKPFMQTSKLLSVGNVTYRFRINTANTLTGATQVAIFTTTTTLSYAQMQRTFTLRDGLLYGYAFTGSTLNDFSNTGGALTSTSYNTANTLYFFFTVQLANVADSSTISLMAITN